MKPGYNFLVAKRVPGVPHGASRQCQVLHACGHDSPKQRDPELAGMLGFGAFMIFVVLLTVFLKRC
jgi:hypothetical protein